ncbi:glycosyltransferase family 2 protein [Metabacillus malikii]|uniref:Glycosyltransferase involved in cell wall biosynthesis n=1 Tax=Metabacillus malikii TaxID=1504265 RepID=A0ABT9ZL43_9BACI|nr:glycosyltransferase [Metabacillus malikii]MDQ0232506.1 glycosyltransferase involved in cell wall biosynthesis [Metabacillus malikii]
MNKVSVIIPFYNCEYINEAIESVLNQTYHDIELIVVDDGSTEFMDKMIPYLPKITYIRKDNGGTASALNAGIKAATGTYFSWLSSDDLFAIDRIEKQLAFMEQEDAIISFSPYTIINASGDFVTVSTTPFHNNLEFMRRFLKNCPINGCTVLAKIELFDVVGFFDESLRFANDYDMWCKILLHYNYSYFNQNLVFYRVHESMGTKRHSDAILVETEIVKKRYKQAIRELIKREKLKR